MNETPAVVTYRYEGSDRIYAFVKGCDDHLYVNFWNGVDRWQWAYQGVPAADARLGDAASAITSWQFNGFEQQHLHVFVRTRDGRLAEQIWNPTNAHPLGAGWHWQDHGAPAAGVVAADAPDAIAYRRQSGGSLHDVYDRIDVFVRGNDGRLYRNGWDARRGTRQWHNHGRPALGADVRSRSGSITYRHQGIKRIYVFVKGSDGRLWVNFSDNTELQTAWHWADLGRPPNIPVRGRPQAVTYVHDGRERLYVFVRGSDDHLHTCYWNGVDRWEWADLGRPGPTTGVVGEPTVERYHWDGTDRMYAFVRGSDGYLHTCYWDGVDRWRWANLGRPTPPGVTVTSSPAVVPFHWDGTDRLYVFVWGSDDHLHLCYWNGVDRWLWRNQEMPPTKITITGVEWTQAIQFFRPGLSPCLDRPGMPGRCPDNDIALVAQKATVLRVYTDTCQGRHSVVSRVSGTLEIRPAGSAAWESLTPINGPITAHRSTDIDRGQPDHTLNFRIPANRCRGELEVRVTVFDADRPDDTTRRSVPFLRTLSFGVAPRLQIRLIRIRYQNAARNMNVPAPTLADFMNTVQFLLRTYPIPDVQVVGDSVELYDGDFTNLFDDMNPMGAQGSTGPIFSIIDRIKAAEMASLGSRVKYYALYPGPPANQTAAGWGVWPDRAAGEVNLGWVMAQEIGHTCGRGHAPCSVPDPDPNYPNYDMSTPASIGEYGFDIVTSDVKEPATYRDFMSYCTPSWVSPYTYEALAQSCFPPARAFVAAAAAGEEAARGERLYLPITIGKDDRVVLREAPFQITGWQPAPLGEQTPYSVALFGPDGAVLESQEMRLPFPHLEQDDSSHHFTVMLPWHPDARALAVKKDDRILTRFKIAAEAPRIKIQRPAGGEILRGRQTVSWKVSGASQPPTYMLRYSWDGGASWRAVAGNLKENSVTVDMDALPGGEKCLFQVLASAGLRTGAATSKPFRVPERPARLLIASPRDGDSVTAGTSVYLFGAAFLPGGATADPDALRWSSDRDGSLGTGSQVILHTLSGGEHRITLDSDIPGVKPVSVRLMVREEIPDRIGVMRDEPHHAHPSS